MKKPYIRLLVFLALMLVLAFGLTYLSLNHITKTKDVETTKRMNVALVNEDDGTTFHDDPLHFGDTFIKSLDKNEDQKWHVVSRSVAENGLEQGSYDMMVVIPNEFSEKALSINEESPEQVVLDYKINASENDKVQAEAEETVASILNDFNRRIIDVYFASVIGNLQEAQDNVATLVAESREHTDMYNNTVNDSLFGYTDQFENVKNSSQTSKDSFQTFEELLVSFEEGLHNQMDTSEDYQSSIVEIEDVMANIGDLNVDFAKELDEYNGMLTTDNVEDQLDRLKHANDYMKAQFQDDEENSSLSNITTQTTTLKSRLSESLEQVDEAQEKLHALLETGLINEEIEEEIETIIYDAYDVEDGLSELLQTQDAAMRAEIKEHIKAIPTMDTKKIDKSNLSTDMKDEIKNVIAVTNKYRDDVEPVETTEEDILTDHVETLIQHLKHDGMTMTDTVHLPKNKKSGQEFRLQDIPEAFTIEYLRLTLPNQATKTYEGDQAKEKIELPSNEEGKFTVEIKLTLKDKYEEDLASFDVYNQTASWGWKIEQKDINDELSKEISSNTLSYYQTETTLVASSTDEDGNEETDEETERDEDEESEEGDDEAEDEENETEDQEEDESEDNDEDESENDEENEDQDDQDEEDEIEEVEIINNQIQHKVTEPVIDEATVNLIHVVENTISPYQKLLSLYETYYGLDLTSEEEQSNEFAVADDESLQNLATEDSLYYLFNQTNIKDLMADYILNKLEEDVKAKIDEPIIALENDIAAYRTFISETDDNAEQLIEEVKATKEEARHLNDNVQETLSNISTWREESAHLLDSQTNVQSKDEEGQLAVTSLGQEFEPLLTQSQSLRDQSSSNLESAEHVYTTFDRVDEQAEQIQQSGTDLIGQADHLSENMTDKLVEDEKFVENFSTVLENSRIGDQQNEDLYDFLSSPVDTESKGLMIKGDTFTPYFLVLIGFILALFTGYVISTTTKRNLAKNQFDANQSLIGSNMLITGITACIGVVEGLVIGLLSANYLGLSQGRLVMWVGLIILVILAMLFISAYLLRQLQMIGMFILLALMSMYLFLTKALGSGFSEGAQLRAYSPLQYVENMLSRFIQGNADYQSILVGIIIFIILGILGNLLVVDRSQRNVAEGDTNATQSQA